MEEDDTNISMLFMEERSYFRQVHTYVLTEEDEKKPLFELMKSFPPEFMKQPLFKAFSPKLSKLKINTENITVDVAEKKLDQLKPGTYISNIEDTGNVERMLLSKYIEEGIQQGTTTVKDFICNTWSQGHEFKYLSNVPVPDNMFDLAQVDLPWDFKDVGIEGDFEGINTPYLYVSTPGSVAPWHLEDGNNRSFNAMFKAETPKTAKIWFAVHKKYIPKVIEILQSLSYGDGTKPSDKCPVFWRHKHHLVDMSIFVKHNIPVYKTIQYPGEIVITNSFHQVLY